MADVEGDFQRLSLEDAEEEEAVRLEEHVSSTGESLENYLVETFLTSSVVNFSSMKVTLANIWHPIGRITIFDLSDGRFLLHDGDDPKTIPLNIVDLWILVQELLHLFTSEVVATQMGNFIGQFIDYDCKSITLSYTEVLRVKLGHRESFCPLHVLQDDQELSFSWDISLKVPFRHAVAPSNRWLREEGGGLIRRNNMDLVITQDEPSNRLSSGGFDDVVGEDDPMVNGEGLKQPHLHLDNSEGNNNRNGDKYQNKISAGLAQRSRWIEGVRRSCGYLNGIDVSSVESSGGLSLEWKLGISVTLRLFSNSHIDILINEDINGKCWRYTGFYGTPQETCREDLWQLLRQLNDCP
ncbi:hypothetical protein Gogos_013100, partial [Gossypium gossypioides]|nr:hypothetical protein [Gossypium gossypioides]